MLADGSYIFHYHSTTDAEKGLLKQIAEKSGYRQFIIPANIGGRYSVLTPVGLLPVAVAGVDIEQLLAGANNAATVLKNENLEQNEAYRYTVIRQALYKKGYKIELLASFEPCLAKLHEWWKQLFGESEGRCLKIVNIITNQMLLRDRYATKLLWHIFIW